MYVLYGAMFLAFAAWCSLRLHRGSRARGTALVTCAMFTAYALMVTSRSMDGASAFLSLIGLDLMLGVLGVQGVLALLKAFDPAPGAPNDDDDDDGGLPPAGAVGPFPAGPYAYANWNVDPSVIDWNGFDAARAAWEGSRREPVVRPRARGWGQSRS